MLEKDDSTSWNPYVAGALTGVLMVLSVLVAGHHFGASTSFVRTAGLIEQTFAPEHVQGLAYYAKEFEKAAGLDWQWMFVFGIFLGSLLSSLTSGSFRWTPVPDSWRERFGPSPMLRGLTAFVGGGIALFGARMAGGCPSGHGLSGLAQLAVSGYLALAMFFIGGLVVARILYKGR
ncbi:MAG: YeeE/YedE thiosulfate transporter family protein [Desulfovibrionaceae bacterium]